MDLYSVTKKRMSHVYTKHYGRILKIVLSEKMICTESAYCIDPFVCNYRIDSICICWGQKIGTVIVWPDGSGKEVQAQKFSRWL